MYDTVQKFTNLGKLFSDACHMSFSLANAYMRLPKRLGVIRCKANQSCVAEAVSQFSLPSAWQGFSKELNIYREEETCSSAEVKVKVVEAFEVQGRPDVWKVPEGLLSMQQFSLLILFYWSTQFSREELFRDAKSTPESQ